MIAEMRLALTHLEEGAQQNLQYIRQNRLSVDRPLKKSRERDNGIAS